MYEAMAVFALLMIVAGGYAVYADRKRNKKLDYEELFYAAERDRTETVGLAAVHEALNPPKKPKPRKPAKPVKKAIRKRPLVK